MLEKEIINAISGRQLFSLGEYFRFYTDRDDIADNLSRRHKGEIRNALECSAELVKKIEAVYEKAFI